MVKWFRSSSGRVGVNETHAPILLIHWEGRMDCRLLQEYFTWKVRRLDAHIDWGDVVLIHDLTRVARPSPGLRRCASGWISDTHERTRSRVLRNVAIVNNPVIAGALRALDWMSGHHLAETVRTLPAAFEIAREALVSGGRPQPSLDPTRYIMPSRAPSAPR